MYFSRVVSVLIATVVYLTSATILQNGQVRITNYPNTVIDAAAYQFQSYQANATELSYKGRWDSKYLSWWSAPGLKFGFTGNEVAISFGPLTTDTVLVAYRVSGQDWTLTNITKGATHLLVSAATPGVRLSYPINPSTFELRVTNWAYGVQIDSVHISKGEKLVKIPDFGRSIELIGDSLTSGDLATLEGLSSYGYGLAAGLGDTEYSITAYPGICAFDKVCWGNPRGMFYQWYYTSDVSWRATQIYGDNPEPWDFSRQPAADIVIINLGTNDANAANSVTSAEYVSQYTMLIQGVHAVFPEAQIILISLWNGFYANGNSYAQAGAWVSEIYEMYKHFNTPEYLANPTLYSPSKNGTYSQNSASAPFVHYFNTTGILQHNDISPQWHPTDVGHIKLASHLQQYIKLKFGWDFYATGPEVFHQTEYWNDQDSY
ncbi:GDSL-like Lipase/Acylhydrolase-like protein [Amylocarpus encephaloides]|uniref:GDSL-like Lipase/Acylhydrolase-like protein n=1 Tax=Amylocarpus encephaloides TaxID=45428 RepID=A0A9P7YRZ7_9HELO|nr:GDSL-like Lipase/Acylhydrolase-like protein [Amylocarpus encephaloides]